MSEKKTPKSNITQKDIEEEDLNLGHESATIPSGNKRFGNINFENVENVFYDVITNSEGQLQRVKIKHDAFISVINELGIYRFPLENDYIFILRQNGIINEVSPTEIQEIFIGYLKSLPDIIKHPKCDFNKKRIEEVVYEKNSNLFSKTKLSLLPSADIVFNKDSKEKGYMYYKNGFVECSYNGYSLKDYSELKGNIWKSQIMNREFFDLKFNTIDETIIYKVIVAKFYFLIANSDFERLKSLCSCAGYLMHNYFKTDLKALILTDSKLSDIAEGRTGKGLYVHTLSYVRETINIDGKALKNDDKHKYQNVGISTQIVHLEDLKPRFNIEDIFNDITAGIKVEPKGKISFNVKAKMVLSCNKTINIQGSSAKGRTIEFELSEYFSDKRTPEMEFKHYFFTDWEKMNEWQNYDNFMALCLCYYLNNGIIKAQEINLSKRSVRDHTCYEFAEWIEEKTIEFDKSYDKKQLHEEFLNQNEDIKNDQFNSKIRTFVQWLKTWARTYGLKPEETKSNSKSYIKFIK